MKFQKLADFWHSYDTEVIEPEAPPIQHSECQMSFYAGARAIIALLEEGKKTEDLLDEINQFVQLTKAETEGNEIPRC